MRIRIIVNYQNQSYTISKQAWNELLRIDYQLPCKMIDRPAKWIRKIFQMDIIATMYVVCV